MRRDGAASIRVASDKLQSHWGALVAGRSRAPPS